MPRMMTMSGSGGVLGAVMPGNRLSTPGSCAKQTWSIVRLKTPDGNLVQQRTATFDGDNRYSATLPATPAAG
ncbi:hypothetical protein [Dactylosporangium salmoneum]|uniref:Ricin B lectin domain-containing protein n=1 Tax=Dactylosporangium salmoneum TaxID=53361 RepID=A0ABN3H8H2_9ACTN